MFSSSVNHRQLIDRGLTRDNGDDLQVHYHDNGQHPVQIDRVIVGLGTKSATVQFRLQAPISANTVDDSSYSLVLGAAVSGSAMDNPDKVYSQSALLGEKKLPADSCKQIHDTSLVKNQPRAKNGVYWIKTDLKGSSVVQNYCDMKNGGWTLVDKISGKVGNIYKTWLVSNYNTVALKTPKITKQKQFACIDARSPAVEEASTVLLSSGERADGLGSKWVM